MSHRQRLLARLAFIATFAILSLFLLTTRASAHDVPKLPAHATSAVVRVDAYEHESLGAVVGDGHLIVVPFEVIEVARPGFPHAIVTDANGVRHDAGLAATDRSSGLALLAVEQAITTTPFALSPSTLADAPDVFAIVTSTASGSLPDSAWSFYPAGSLTVDGQVRAIVPHPGMSPWPPRAGAPIIDVEGRLIALMGTGTFLTPRPLGLTPEALARLDGSQRGRRNVIFYGGTTVPFSFAPNGGLWFGLGLTFSTRVRDVLELRLDAEFSALVPTTRPPPESCGGRCYAGIRGVATPSIGYRYVLGGVGGARAWPIALTPSIGVALGVQDTSRENGATAYDAATPSAWAQPTPGLTFSVWAFDIHSRVRIPLDGSRSPTIELGLGVTF